LPVTPLRPRKRDLVTSLPGSLRSSIRPLLWAPGNKIQLFQTAGLATMAPDLEAQAASLSDVRSNMSMSDMEMAELLHDMSSDMSSGQSDGNPVGGGLVVILW